MPTLHVAREAEAVSAMAREMRPADEPFLYNSWLRACRKCPRHEGLPSQVYYQDTHEQIERLIRARPVVSVLMAVGIDNDDSLLGYICTEKLGGEVSVLHFAYVKKDHRKQGLFRWLAHQAGLELRRPFFYTAHTPIMNDMGKVLPHAVYRRDILNLMR